MSSARSALRDLTYRSIVSSGLPRLRRRLSEGAAVFCFHNVVAEIDAGGGDGSLHLRVPSFERIVDWIGRTYRVVPLSEIASRIGAGRPVSGLAALSFDDAYRGVFAHALPRLARRGLHATVFVVPGATAEPRAFWWDMVGGAGRLDGSTRDRCLAEHAGDREAILAAVAPPAPHLSADYLPADWAMVRAARSGAVAFGAHTMTHRNLAALPADAVRYELRESRRALADRLGTEPELVSYPYGLHDARVVEEAHDAGYRGGFTMRRALALPSDHPLAISRFNVPAGISPNALECRAADLQLRRAS